MTIDSPVILHSFPLAREGFEPSRPVGPGLSTQCVCHSTIWLSVPSAGFEPAISGLKARRPLRRHHEGGSVCRAGVEPAQRMRVGYSHLGSPMPSRHVVRRDEG